MENIMVVLLLLCTLASAEEALSSAEEALSQSNLHPKRFNLYSELRDINVKLAKDRLFIQQLQKDKQELEAKLKELGPMKDKLEAQAAELANMKTWIKVTENQVKSLWRDRAVGQVAFSASLLASGHGFIGPYKTPTSLVFRRVISNIGNAYNPKTGFFIAPVRGAYHFELYVGSHSGSYHTSGVYLVKNGENVVIAYERGPNGHSSAANGATLLLKPGDVVFPRLHQATNIYDNQNHHSSFSGHLLFPM